MGIAIAPVTSVCQVNNLVESRATSDLHFSARAMWNDPVFLREFISCLADMQSSPGTSLAESQSACVCDACSTLLNLITHLRDASGLPGSTYVLLMHFMSFYVDVDFI